MFSFFVLLYVIKINKRMKKILKILEEQKKEG